MSLPCSSSPHALAYRVARWGQQTEVAHISPCSSSQCSDLTEPSDDMRSEFTPSVSSQNDGKPKVQRPTQIQDNKQLQRHFPRHPPHSRRLPNIYGIHTSLPPPAESLQVKTETWRPSFTEPLEDEQTPTASPTSGRLSFFSDVGAARTNSTPCTPYSPDEPTSEGHWSHDAQQGVALPPRSHLLAAEEHRRAEAAAKAQTEAARLNPEQTVFVSCEEDAATPGDFHAISGAMLFQGLQVPGGGHDAQPSSVGSAAASSPNQPPIENATLGDVTPKARELNFRASSSSLQAKGDERLSMTPSGQPASAASSTSSGASKRQLKAVGHSVSLGELSQWKPRPSRVTGSPRSMPPTPSSPKPGAPRAASAPRSASQPQFHSASMTALPSRSESAPPSAPDDHFRAPPLPIRFQRALSFSIFRCGIPSMAAYGALVGVAGAALTFLGLFDSVTVAWFGLAAMSWPLPAIATAATIGVFGYKVFFPDPWQDVARDPDTKENT